MMDARHTESPASRLPSPKNKCEKTVKAHKRDTRRRPEARRIDRLQASDFAFTSLSVHELRKARAVLCLPRLAFAEIGRIVLFSSFLRSPLKSNLKTCTLQAGYATTTKRLGVGGLSSAYRQGSQNRLGLVMATHEQ